MMYDEKSKIYYRGDRPELLRIISSLGRFESAIEIGCGAGNLLKSLKRAGIVKQTAGVEAYCRDQSEADIDELHLCTVEEALPRLARSPKRDLLIAADVLEHLVDPWNTLELLVSELLAPDGVVILSLPNFRNIGTVASIVLKNSFAYSVEGVLDRTHLRFFCLPDMLNLAKNSGLIVKQVWPRFALNEMKLFRTNRQKLLNLMTFNVMPYWIADQVVIYAVRSSSRTSVR